MTKQQLNRVIKFSQPYYEQNDRYHDWSHVLMVKRYAREIIQAEKISLNWPLLGASIYLHDIGYCISDYGHPEIGAQLAYPFLNTLRISSKEKEIILEAVGFHDKDDIKQAKSLEARVLFDADALQVISVFGFVRCWMWLVEERQMSMNQGYKSMHDWCTDVLARCFKTDYALSLAQDEFKKVNNLGRDFFTWQDLDCFRVNNY